jgi:hypothetical protein
MLFWDTQADCVNLLVKYYKEARRAICLSNEEDARAKRDGSRDSQAAGRTASARTMEVKSKTRGETRCCMCFDPFSIRDVSVVAFFCCHAYHMSCLMDSMHTVSSGKGSGATSGISEYDSNDEDEETVSGVPRLRCILCTTAASWDSDFSFSQYIFFSLGGWWGAGVFWWYCASLSFLLRGLVWLSIDLKFGVGI